jgi:hypothetical protein
MLEKFDCVLFLAVLNNFSYMVESDWYWWKRELTMKHKDQLEVREFDFERSALTTSR